MEFQPGDLGFSKIKGKVGLVPAWGMLILGDQCRYDHIWMAIGNNKLIEAMPSGARIVDITEDRLVNTAWFRLPLSPGERFAIANKAPAYEGTPYSFVDYLQLAMVHFNVPGNKRVRKYVQDSGRMICSQLVDHILCESGYHVFDDGRLPMDVTPGDMYYAADKQGKRLI